jgi:hypothetical protein
MWRRIAALVAAVLLASVSGVTAGDITYSIVDYPLDETDVYGNGGTDTISGMITTDGTLGTWYGGSNHVVSGFLTLEAAVGSMTLGSAWVESAGGSEGGPPILYATQTQLQIPVGYYAVLGANTADNTEVINFDYNRDYDPPGYTGIAEYIVSNGWDAGWNSTSPSGLPGSIAANDPWVVATALQPGDANGDGRVDINDLTIVLAHYNQRDMTWSQGEFTGDGTVDINDLTIVLANYGWTGAYSGVMKAVPEPSCLLLLAIGAVGLLAFAWQRRAKA